MYICNKYAYMKHYVAILLLLIAILPMRSATKRALLIGISEYPINNKLKDAAWQPIHGVNDVDLVSKTLSAQGFKLSTLKNSNATASKIRRALNILQSETRSGDIVYLHFSCHGQPVEDMNEDEEDGWDESIVPYDAQMVYKKGKYEGGNHIIDDELHSVFQKLMKKVGPSGLVCVVIDACHAGNSYMGYEEDDSFCRGTKKGFSPHGESFHPRINVKGNFPISKSTGQSDIIILEACRSSSSTKFLLYITDCQSVGDIFVLPFGGDFGGDWGAILLKGAIAIVCPSICDLRICL